MACHFTKKHEGTKAQRHKEDWERPHRFLCLLCAFVPLCLRVNVWRRPVLCAFALGCGANGLTHADPVPPVADLWFDAASENHYATVKGMLDGGYDVHTTQRVTELTALHFAAGGGAGETVAMLLFSGAVVDARDTVEMTALHHACELGQAKIAEVLIAHGADVNAVGGVHGYTPLHLAVQNDHTDLAGTLLDAGADLNTREGHGATPLHFAVLHGRTAAVERLIERGADVHDATTRDGYTALHLAALRDHADLARLLIERGADADLKDSAGMTPRQRATDEGSVGVVEVLRAVE